MGEPYNDLMQVKMSIKAAERMIGQATMSMDHNQLNDAKRALNDAKHQYQNAIGNATGVDNMFLAHCGELISQCEQQINEALR